MKTYAVSAQAVNDMITVVRLHKQEILHGFLDNYERSKMDQCSVRLNELGGVEAVEIMMRCANLFIRELRR